MMDDKIIFKPEKGTASYNPLIDNIEDTNTQEAFAGAKRFASILGMKHCRSIGLIYKKARCENENKYLGSP